jgi:predicted nuclease of predicted toxin-antitoxin system
MRFLVDAQLPPALARWLAARGHEASHLLDLGLLGAADIEIWQEAKRLDAVIVSKDEDFVHLRTLHPEGPSLVWVRVGNTSRRQLLDWLAQLFPEIERALLAGERLVELAPSGQPRRAQPAS